MLPRGLFQDLHTVLVSAGKPSQRLFLLSGLLSICTATLDAIGVGAIVPFVALLSMSDLFVRYPAFAAWVPQNLQDDRISLIMTGAGLLALIYVLRAVCSLASAFVVAHLQGTLARDVCRVLFVSYIRRPYAYHLEKGPAYFTTRLSPSVYMTNCTVQGVAQFCVEALTAILVLVVVLYASPMAASISIVVLGLPAALLHYRLKGETEQMGRATQDLSERSIKVMLSGIGGIKELKVLGREDHFQKQYWEIQNQFGSIIGRYSLYTKVPRVMLELGAVVAILAMCIVLALQGRTEQLMPMLALYAAAAFRLLPSAIQLLSSLMNIHHNASGLAMVAADLREELPAQPPRPSMGRHADSSGPLQQIELQDVSFRYRSELSPVLNQVNFIISAGQTLGLVGESGAGKSTLVDVLLGLLEPTSGRILLNGRDSAGNLRELQRRIGYVPQAIYLVDDTIRRNVCLGLDDAVIDDEQVWKALTAAQLTKFVLELPGGLDTNVGERGVKLSGGQRQRIGIARALYHEPEVLIFDEATSALDNLTENEFMQAIEQLRGGKTILLVAHRLTTLQTCNDIFEIKAGQLYNIGKYSTLIARSSHLLDTTFVK